MNATTTTRQYSDVMTADVNDKGVLDVDTVKGCTSGIAAHGARGCYQACYAASIAKFRGIDFSHAIVRKVHSKAHAVQIETAVKHSPFGFFRIGTMGDPCHAWEYTVEVVEWLAPFAVPVIITKHWRVASDRQIARLIECGTVMNTSVSALDNESHLARRMHEIERYAKAGGASVARVVSCDFNTDDPVGARMASVQARLLSLDPVIDNPLRVASTHPDVVSRVIKLRKVKDLIAVRTISVSENSTAYVGHCAGCTDLCGAGLLKSPDVRPASRQQTLL